MTDKKVWTLKSVAKELGVSNATVSNAFNRPDQLSKNKRIDILESCKKLGYTGPNKAAQSLRKGQSNIVALVLPDSLEYMVTDPVASDFVKGVSSVLEKSKVNLLLFSGISDNINTVADFVDGFICYGSPRNPELIEQLRVTSKKVVTADFDIDRNASVGIDNEKAAYEIAKLAIKSTNDEVAILGLRLLESDLTCRVYELPMTSNALCSISHQRLNGYRQALKDCMSDIIALAAVKEIHAMGLKVPEDIRVVGFDGIDEALRSTPSITTVHQNSEEKGIKAAELFINRATNSVVISYHIEHGKSC